MGNKHKGNSSYLRDITGRILQETSTIYSNLSQGIIITTEDKLRLNLIDFKTRLTDHRSWISPLGIFLAILIVFPTTSFKEFLGISPDTWQAMFIFTGLLSFGWLIKTIFRIQSAASIDQFVLSIKTAAINPLLPLPELVSDDDEFSIKLILSPGIGPRIFNPTNEDIKTQLNSLDEWGDYGFLSLLRTPSTYMQTYGDSSIGFILEYREESRDNHFRSPKEHLSQDATLSSLISYAQDDDNWRTGIEWQQLEID